MDIHDLTAYHDAAETARTMTLQEFNRWWFAQETEVLVSILRVLRGFRAPRVGVVTVKEVRDTLLREVEYHGRT